MAWPQFLIELVKALRKAAAPLFAYFAGRARGADAAEDKARAARDAAREKQHEADNTFERLRRDADFRERVRGDLRDADGDSE